MSEHSTENSEGGYQGDGKAFVGLLVGLGVLCLLLAAVI
jgi:hypothetical protein